ncbi:hypothetical protein LJR230_001398 [Trinickia sp. LjRoot230]|uniref:hypothetical protein n=1 Tax=Trinickia sp. LjRoot230 TaxID=3342288 RepID=UPI003ED0FAB4
MIDTVLHVSPKLLPEDKATLLEAIASNRGWLSSVPRGTVERIFDQIRTLPERYQFGLLGLLLRNAEVFARSHDSRVGLLRSRIDNTMRALTGKPGAVIATARGTPQAGLPDIVESLFGGVESRIDRLSPQLGSAAIEADRLAALSGAAASIFELVDRGDRSNDLPKKVSAHLLDRILALEEPRHRFAALRLLVSRPLDAQATEDALGGEPVPYRGELLDIGAFARILDAMPTLPPRYQSVLLEAIVPDCIATTYSSEKVIMVKRVLDLLPRMDVEDRIVPLLKLVKSLPVSSVRAPARPALARAIANEIFRLGAQQPPELVSEFAFDASRRLASGPLRELVNEIIRFVSESPRELQRAQAKALLSIKLMPLYTEAKLRSMAGDW